MALGERLGGAHVDIDANADPFYREMDKMDRKADAAAREARRKIDRQLKNLKFDAAFVLATKKAEAEAKRLEKKYSNQNWHVDIDVSKLKDVYMPKIKAILDDIEVPDTLEDVHFDVEIGNKHHVKEELDDIAEDREVEFDPEVNSPSKYATQAVLAMVGRPRTVEFYTKLNSGALTKVASSLAALSGMRMLTNQTDSLVNLVKNLDKSIPRLSALSVGIGLVGNGLISLTSNASALLTNVGQMAGAALALPSLFAGAAIGITTMVVGLKDISNRLPGISGMMDDLTKNMQNSFWEGALNGVSNFIDTAFADFSDGLITTSKATGEFTGQLADSFAKAFDTKAINTMFDNLNKSIQITTDTTGDLANIFRVLGESGSQYLPRMASWVGDLTGKFSNWLSDIEKTGRLNEIIDTGVERIKGLGNVLLYSGQIIARVGKIAEESGAVSINSMADALGRAADVVGREPFKSNLTRVFTSAHTAIDQITSKSGPAFTNLMKTMSHTIPDILSNLAPAVGNLLDGLFKGLDSSGFQKGLSQMFKGIGEGVSGFSKFLPDIISNFGSLGSVIGTLAKSFLPLLGQWLSSLTNVFATLAPVIQPLIPLLTSFTNVLAKAFNPAVLATLLAFGPGLRMVSAGMTALAATSLPVLAKLGAGFTALVTGSGKAGKAIRGLSTVATASLGLLMKPLGATFSGVAKIADMKFGTNLASSFSKTAGAATAASSATTAAATATGAAAASTSKASGLFSKMGGALKIAGTAAVGLLGPIGIAGATIVAAAGGALLLANNMYKTSVDTSLAAQQLQSFKSATENIRGSELDKLLSTGWGPWTSEVNTAQEAYQKFGKTAAATASSLSKGIESNHDIKSYKNDIEQLDQIIAGMVASGNISGAKTMYEGFRSELRNAGGDVAYFENRMTAANQAFADQGIKIKSTTGYYEDLTGRYQEAINNQKNLELATRSQTEKMADYAGKYKLYNEEIFSANTNIRNALNQYEDLQITDATGAIISMSEAFSAAEYSSAGLTNSYEGFKQAMVTGTRPMRDYGSALESIIQNDLAAIQSGKQRGMSMSELTDLSGELYDSFLELAGGDEQLKAQLATLAKENGLYPAEEAAEALSGAYETTIKTIGDTQMAITKLANGKYVVNVDGQEILATNQQVEDLGIKVEKLPDGSFMVNGTEHLPASWGGDLQGYLEALEKKREMQVDLTFNANTNAIETSMGILNKIGKDKAIEMNVSANTGPADTEIRGWVLGKKNTKMDVNVDANTASAQQGILALSQTKNAVQVPVDADTGRAMTTINDLPYHFNSNPISFPVDADTTQAASKISGFALGALSQYNIKMGTSADTSGADIQIGNFTASAGSGKYSVGIPLQTKVVADTFFGADGVVSNINTNFRGWISTATSYGSDWAVAATGIAQFANSQFGYVNTGAVQTSNWAQAALRVLSFTNQQTGFVGAGSVLRSTWTAAAGVVRNFTNAQTGFVGASSVQRGGWTAAPNGIRNYVNGMSASIRVGTVMAGGALSGAYALAARVSSIVAKIRTTSNNGNIFPGLQHFANGGFNRENHLAMIAQAGTRVWAEPETGGEAYIPLALSKRTRSQEILQRTAELLDMTQPVPKSRAFADGGIESNRRPFSSANKDVKVYMSVANGDKMDEEQFGRAVSRELANRLT